MSWLALLVPALGWAVLWQRSRFRRLPTEERRDGTRQTVFFTACDGTRLEGWLFLPKTPHAPVVLMAPGLGGTKDGLLESFAWAFVAQGLAALLFDYRSFGGSDGRPRHWVDPGRQRQDYEAALQYARGELTARGHVDGARVGLWGSSFSGGNVITLGASRNDIRALVAQCPYLKTPPALEPRGLNRLRFVFWTMLDLLRIFPPIYVPLFGRPGEWVFASSAENPSVSDFNGPLGARFWQELPKPSLGGWENRMLARLLATLDDFMPMAHVAKVACPTLLVAARGDDMVPIAYVREAHAHMTGPHKELVEFDGGHFDLYVGGPHASNAQRQAAFFAHHLGSRDN